MADELPIPTDVPDRLQAMKDALHLYLEAKAEASVTITRFLDTMSVWEGSKMPQALRPIMAKHMTSLRKSLKAGLVNLLTLHQLLQDLLAVSPPVMPDLVPILNDVIAIVKSL